MNTEKIVTRVARTISSTPVGEYGTNSIKLSKCEYAGSGGFAVDVMAVEGTLPDGREFAGRISLRSNYSMTENNVDIRKMSLKKSTFANLKDIIEAFADAEDIALNTIQVSGIPIFNIAEEPFLCPLCASRMKANVPINAVIEGDVDPLTGNVLMPEKPVIKESGISGNPTFYICERNKSHKVKKGTENV